MTGAEKPSAGPAPEVPAERARNPLSGDGAWWWNGRRWSPAVTEDGLWRWDGSRWVPTTPIDSKRPEDLATSFRLLAERRFAAAGDILADRASEWAAGAEARELARRLREVRRQLGPATGPGPSPGPGRGLLGRLVADDRSLPERDREDLESERLGLAAGLGRSAPRPSVKEADDVLEAARLLDERAGRLAAGLAEVDEAERMRADAALAAQQELNAAEAARARALDQARAAVEAAEAVRARAVAEAQAQLEDVLIPGAGELRLAMGPLRLCANRLETPTGPQPAAGLTAHVGTAAALWREHRQRLADLMLLGAAEADRFRTALARRGDERFLLIAGRSRSSLTACPPNQERAAARFAAAVTEQAGEAAQTEAAREAEARRAEERLDAIAGDRSRIVAAEAEQARVEGDPALLAGIDGARQRLARARADTPEVLEARRKLQELARQLTAAPAPLMVAT